MINKFPFEVPAHEYMALRVPGKRPNTVLTIERQIFTYRICEYSEPLYIGRNFEYGSFDEALAALLTYLTTEIPEPGDWIRAIDKDANGQHRVRRAYPEVNQHGQQTGRRILRVVEDD